MHQWWPTGGRLHLQAADSCWAGQLDDDDARLKGILKNRKCKPDNRKIRQLWRKLLVTDQDRFNAEAGQHTGQDSGGNTSKGAQKNGHQKSKNKLREQHGRGDGDSRPPQGDSKISEVNVAQLICGNTERVQDVMMASSDDYDDEVEADL